MRQGSPFDALVDDYDRARPSYPAELYDSLERLAGPLKGARIVEVGAGTGIATRGLVAAGASVIAMDIGLEMLRRLREHRLMVPVVIADAHSLPVTSGWADLVCYAQAWHWVRADAAAREAVRVLAPRGTLALWWNDGDARDQDWWLAQQERLERANPDFHRDYRSSDVAATLARTRLFTEITHAECRWSRRLDIDAYLSWLRSKSYVARLGARLPAFLEAERRSLSKAFPDGLVQEPFICRLWVARIS
jgi:SAM-dependent methyltransferase